MESKLEIFFGKFSVYICIFLFATSAVLGTGWFISNSKLETQVERGIRLEEQLKTSNASYLSIKNEFVKLTDQLKENQEVALQNQEAMRNHLKTIVDNDRSLQTLEKSLLSRPSETQCVTPKDLADAWSKM